MARYLVFVRGGTDICKIHESVLNDQYRYGKFVADSGNGRAEENVCHAAVTRITARAFYPGNVDELISP